MIQEVYDLECLSNLFTYTGVDVKSGKWSQFVICDWRNDTVALLDHLKDVKLQIGYNNLEYDYPLLHHLLNNSSSYKNWSGFQIASDLYVQSQKIIESRFSSIADKHTRIKQLDLYKIHGFDNANRRCSLKDCEVAMNLENVQEMPINHYETCKPGDEEMILDYNKNDVFATKKLLDVTLGNTDNVIYKGRNKIALRIDLRHRFGLDLLNVPDMRIGERLMLKLYSEATFQNPYELKKCGGTPRAIVYLKDCIPSWIDLKTKEFNDLLEAFKRTCIQGEKGEFKKDVIFHGIVINFLTGGAHACCDPGIYTSTNNRIIVDLDVSSLYPSIAKSLQLYPEHLGKEFITLYSKFIDERIAEKHKPKDQRNNAIIEGFKLLLNSTYGKSKEETSFLYDKLYTYKTTIAGQLFIAMWCERLTEASPSIKIIQINTDGITIMVDKSDLDKIKTVNDSLTEKTSLGIEDNFYHKMIVRDVIKFAS